MKNQSRKFAIAPMMDWTDRHCRAFHRQLSARALLYTEMLTADAIVFGDRARLLGFSPVEHPVALQIGGSDPARAREAARIGAEWGYDEINLNVGCPSDRVQSGRFGACLMREPALVADLVAAMRDGAGDVPVTVKHRLGVDDQNPEETLFPFVETVAQAGCTVFIAHARKALLDGLSPKENREIPPLDYGLVRRLKAAFPHLTIILNGGLRDVAHALHESEGLDGAMLGRAAYQTPATLLDIDPLVFGAHAPSSDAVSAVRAFMPYVESEIDRGAPLHAITRHMLGLFHGKPGGRLWRRYLSENAHKTGAGVDMLRAALDAMLAQAEKFQREPVTTD